MRAAPDGHTLLFTQPAPLVVNKALYGKLTFEPEQFVPIAPLAVRFRLNTADSFTASGELRYNVICDINDHNLLRNGSNGKVHHNVFHVGKPDHPVHSGEKSSTPSSAPPFNSVAMFSGRCCTWTAS